jgi:hypothetical protein
MYKIKNDSNKYMDAPLYKYMYVHETDEGYGFHKQWWP